ncbi:MAG: hypothetical protein J07HQX50_01970 [Haloquadratum sp. J07HQX50]|nr:MAG: hypothetical protein J07HQX50_01970 [Haloquadratum sp. J07HQX50]
MRVGFTSGVLRARNRVAKNNVESRTTTGVELHSLTLSRRLIALAEQFEDPMVQMEKLEDICGTVPVVKRSFVAFPPTSPVHHAQSRTR